MRSCLPSSLQRPLSESAMSKCENCKCENIEITEDSYSPHWTEMSPTLDSEDKNYATTLHNLFEMVISYPVTFETAVKLYNYFKDISVVDLILHGADMSSGNGQPFEYLIDQNITDYLDNAECDEVVIEEELLAVNPLKVQVGGSHYKEGSIQPAEYAHANALDPIQRDIVKYITRFRDKGGISDLKKIVHYTQILSFQEYGRTISVHPETGEVIDLGVRDG